MSDVEALMNADTQRRVAMVSSDVVALGDYLADDLSWTHSSGKTDSKESFLAGMASGTTVYHSLDVRDTKLGTEELTDDIPNVSEEATSELDENGMIRVGADVTAGDILIGKITPKGESDPTPEEKLLRAIFGDKAGDVKDASLKAPPSLNGIVIDKKLFVRSLKDKRTRSQDKVDLELLQTKYEKILEDHRLKLVDKLASVINGKTCQGVFNDLGDEVLVKGKKFSNKMLSNVEDYTHLTKGVWTTSDDLNAIVSTLLHNYRIHENDIQGSLRREKFTISVGDELPPGIKKLAKVYIAKKRKLKVGDKMAGRHGNKGIVARIVRQEDMPFLEDGTPVDIVLNPLGVPSRMNIGQIYETVLGWAGEQLGRKFSTPIFDGASLDDINKYKAEEQEKDINNKKNHSINYDEQDNDIKKNNNTLYFIILAIENSTSLINRKPKPCCIDS